MEHERSTIHYPLSPSRPAPPLFFRLALGEKRSQDFCNPKSERNHQAADHYLSLSLNSAAIATKIIQPHLINSTIKMSEERRSRSRSRSRSPERTDEGAPAADNNAPPAEGGAPAENGGAEEEGVKLYVGNLDYCELHLIVDDDDDDV